MERKEMGRWFGVMAQNYVWRLELPQEGARRWAETCRAHGVDYSRYIGYWAGLLLTLSRLVRAEGAGAHRRAGSSERPTR